MPQQDIMSRRGSIAVQRIAAVLLGRKCRRQLVDRGQRFGFVAVESFKDCDREDVRHTGKALVTEFRLHRGLDYVKAHEVRGA